MEDDKNPVPLTTPPVLMEAVLPTQQSAPREHVSSVAPLREPIFRNLWIANCISNIGSTMQSAAAPWLMATLVRDDPHGPLLVAMVQAASSLAIFLLALPAGALADVVDRRHLLIFTQLWMLVAAGVLGVLTLLGLVPPWVLLLLTFMLGLGTAMNNPAWMAAIPEMVPRREMSAAVVLNSVAFNLAFAVGPALQGLILDQVGQFLDPAHPVVLGVVLVLYFWKRPAHESLLPTERVLGAIRTGLRYVRHSPPLRIVFLRTTGFILCGSTLLTLLPVYAKELNLDSLYYGILFFFFGGGAVLGAFFIHQLRRRFGIDALIVGSTLLFALGLGTLATGHNFLLLCGGTMAGGFAWMTLMGTYMVAAQSVVPSWVRARALAVFMMVFGGAMSLASVLWGTMAQNWGTRWAFAFSGLGLVLGIPIMWRWRLTGGENLDLTPALAPWPAHSGIDEPDHEHGPVLIMVEYRIDPARARDFTQAMNPVRLNRLRDGAMRWGLFHPTSDPGSFLETFIVESWIEHLRQHERMTVTDQEAERRARTFHIGPEPPTVSHYIAAPLETGSR